MASLGHDAVMLTSGWEESLFNTYGKYIFLSKLDGVDQLNNILLIGMTNRKDMIDDALLRPGRLVGKIRRHRKPCLTIWDF